MSLLFVYVFVNKQWATTIDVMIGRKENARKIHHLRGIGIPKADFYAALKILSARTLMDQAERNGIHNNQWGSRSNRTSTDPVLQKLATFEYSRYMKATITVSLSDQTACFDHMHPNIKHVITQALGMDLKPCLCHNKMIDASERHIITALGVSKGSYKNALTHRIYLA